MCDESKPNAEFKPLHNVCEFLNALHVYTDEAKQGVTRYVEANHYCSHYMVPRHVYETLDQVEQKLWHSHEFEVKSGMLVLPKPAGWEAAEWEKAEYEAMKGVVNLYGKTWHFWQVDKGDELPLGYPTSMGSLTHESQMNIDPALEKRNESHAVNHKDKAKGREDIDLPGVHPNADSWWKNWDRNG